MQGLFSAIYTDRGSHYRHIPEAGVKVDKIARNLAGP